MRTIFIALALGTFFAVGCADMGHMGEDVGITVRAIKDEPTPTPIPTPANQSENMYENAYPHMVTIYYSDGTIQPVMPKEIVQLKNLAYHIQVSSPSRTD